MGCGPSNSHAQQTTKETKKGKQVKILSQTLLLVWLGARPGAGAGLSTGRDRINHAGDQPEPVGCVALHFANACQVFLK